jgi:hypothetical protein
MDRDLFRKLVESPEESVCDGRGLYCPELARLREIRARCVHAVKRQYETKRKAPCQSGAGDEGAEKV